MLSCRTRGMMDLAPSEFISVRCGAGVTLGSQTRIHKFPRPLGGRKMASGVQTWLEALQMARGPGFLNS